MSRGNTFIQLYDQQRDPIFMDLHTGKLFWILPNEQFVANVQFVTHVSDDGKFYYENVTSAEVTWELPKEKMSFTAADTAALVIKLTRKVLENKVGSKYDESKSNAQMVALDNYLREKDAIRLQFGQDGNQSSDEEVNFRPSRLSTMQTTESVKKNVVKSGYMMKLATVSGRNWKKRFFAATPYCLAYYVDENLNQKPKGELQIVPDAVVQEEKVDKKYGYGFRYTNNIESIVVAASTELDRAHWIQTLQTLINNSANYLRAVLTILPVSTVLSSNSKGLFSSSRTATKKFCILTDEVLTIHPDKQITTTVEGLININENTRIDVDESTFQITLTDSDARSSRLALQFNNGIDDQKYFVLWKKKLNALIFDYTVPVDTVKTNNRNISNNEKQPKEEIEVQNTTQNQKTQLPSNIAVFGLALSDDEDEGLEQSNEAFQPTTNIAEPEPEPEPEKPKTTSKRPSKPLGKSFLKMRSKSTKERNSLSVDATEPLAAPKEEANLETSDSYPENLGFNSQSNMDFPVYNSVDEEIPFVSQIPFTSTVPDAAVRPSIQENEASSSNQYFNPIAATRRKSLLGPPPPPPTESLFIQSLKSKSDAPNGGEQSFLTNPAASLKSMQQPPPPPRKEELMSNPYPLTDSMPKRKLSVPTFNPISVGDVPDGHVSDSFQPFAPNIDDLVSNTINPTDLRVKLQDYLNLPADPSFSSAVAFDEILKQPIQSFLSETNQILLSCEDRMKQLISQNARMLPTLAESSPKLQYAARQSAFSLEKIENYLKNQSYVHPGDGSVGSSYQQLLQEKEVIVNLLRFLKVSEENMVTNIQLFEYEALQRIKTEGNFYKAELSKLEDQIKTMNQQNYIDLTKKLEDFNIVKSVLHEKYLELQENYESNLNTLVLVAKDLQKQQTSLFGDRKKMLKQRYQLDLLLQDINDVQLKQEPADFDFRNQVITDYHSNPPYPQSYPSNSIVHGAHYSSNSGSMPGRNNFTHSPNSRLLGYNSHLGPLSASPPHDYPNMPYPDGPFPPPDYPSQRMEGRYARSGQSPGRSRSRSPSSHTGTIQSSPSRAVYAAQAPQPRQLNSYGNRPLEPMELLGHAPLHYNVHIDQMRKTAPHKKPFK